MTQPEIWLWARLKRLRERGYHFRRQAPFRGYYLDFVCFDRTLAVELDGGQHSEDIQADHDTLRDRVLAREGFRVMRFWNSAVREDIDWVMDSIVLALEARASVATRRREYRERPVTEADLPTRPGASRRPPSP
ncbi:MAG: hypothetical protein JWQ29_106 [Phenylobacterium sp.]|nr:hypothetical protein [Phenylobacterium sp.]